MIALLIIFGVVLVVIGVLVSLRFPDRGDVTTFMWKDITVSFQAPGISLVVVGTLLAGFSVTRVSEKRSVESTKTPSPVTTSPSVPVTPSATTVPSATGSLAQPTVSTAPSSYDLNSSRPTPQLSPLATPRVQSSMPSPPAALPSSPSPSPSQTLQVQNVAVYCAKPWTQRCAPPFRMKISTNGPSFSYKFTAWGCSDIQLILYVDNDQLRDVTPYLGLQNFSTGWRPPIEVSPGSHDLNFWAVGKTGGCNKGFVSNWGGTLELHIYQ